jgi:hypothetical protein
VNRARIKPSPPHHREHRAGTGEGQTEFEIRDLKFEIKDLKSVICCPLCALCSLFRSMLSVSAVASDVKVTLNFDFQSDSPGQ